MSSSKAKSRRKATPQSTPRSALEDEDWTTKSMRLIEENFKRNGGVNKRATPEDRLREAEDWKRTQNETSVHEADPAAAVRRWRELWGKREPGGDNEDFEDLCDQFHYYSDVLGEFCGPDDLEEQTTEGQLFRVWKGLYEAGLTEACTIIARDDGLFTEKEVS
ncbi:hypothetical protein PENSPDRAFT_398390 [Peniophora sp. CONT]|nr:hypothetical protein PENSPDRAFT_398390 [Peniophora sp. CONT]